MKETKTKPVEFFVEGKPVAKGRPRVTRYGTTYTPAKTREWEEMVAWSARIALGSDPPMEVPVAVQLVFYRPRANSDLDNLIKAVLDAMNGLVYADDKQISSIHAIRLPDGEQPGVWVMVKPYEDSGEDLEVPVR